MADEALTVRSASAPALLGAVVVALQIAYPLVHGTGRDHLTVTIVVALAATCLLHAGITRGLHVAVGLLVATAVPGYAVEVLGVHTGFPFGAYTYSDSLGGRILGVPPVIGLAWTMLAWPAALAARQLAGARLPRVLLGAWALAVCDVFLDPQLVAAGAWRWHFPAPHLPGVPQVPLTNFAGWLAVSVVLSVAVQALVEQGARGGAAPAAVGAGLRDGDGVPVALYLWLYIGWVVAQSVFLGLTGAAAWGALAMGTVAVPLAVRCVRPVPR